VTSNAESTRRFLASVAASANGGATGPGSSSTPAPAAPAAAAPAPAPASSGVKPIRWKTRSPGPNRSKPRHRGSQQRVDPRHGRQGQHNPDAEHRARECGLELVLICQYGGRDHRWHGGLQNADYQHEAGDTLIVPNR